MADTVFQGVIPDLLAVDLGSSQYGAAVSIETAAGIPQNIVFDTDPPLRGVDLGDGTYALSVVVQ